MDKRGSTVVSTSKPASKIPASLDGLPECQLRALLETTFNFEERLAIRRAIRQQRKKTVESQDVNRTTAGKTASYLQKDSSEGRRTPLKSNRELQHKSNGISCRKTLPCSNGHNLKVKTTFKSHETDTSETRDVQMTHRAEETCLDLDSTVNKMEQRMCGHVGLESGKLDKKRKEENELVCEMDDVESKNLKNISLKDTVNDGKELKGYVREIEKELEDGKRENGKEELDLVKCDNESQNENVSSVNEMQDDSGCEMKNRRCDEEILNKDGNEIERETRISGGDLETDVELPHKLVEVHIDGGKKGGEGDSQDVLSSQMKEIHQINNAVSEIEKKELEVKETANEEENVAGDGMSSQDDVSLEKKKIGLSDSEKIEDIPLHRAEGSYEEYETEGSLKVEKVDEVVDDQLVASKQDDVDKSAEKDYNSNERSVEEKRETGRDCDVESEEFQASTTPTSDSYKPKDLSRLNLEVSLEENNVTHELQMTEAMTEGISSKSFEEISGRSEKIDDNIIIDTVFKDETSSHGNEKEPHELCDSIEKVDIGCKDKDRTTSSKEQGELQETPAREEEDGFIADESIGKIGTSSSCKEQELQEVSERREEACRSIETEDEGKKTTAFSGKEIGHLGTSGSCTETILIDTEGEGKSSKTLSDRERSQEATESRGKTRSGETEIHGKGTTSSSEREKASEEKEELKLEDINDETVLRQMLDSTFDFDERRKIRAAIRALKKKQQNQPAPEKKAVQQSYLNLQNRSWKSGRNTPECKTNPSPRTYSGRKLGLEKQNSQEKELPQCQVKSNFASKQEVDFRKETESNTSKRGDSVSAEWDDEAPEEQLSSRKALASSVPEKHQPCDSSAPSFTEKFSTYRTVPNETVRDSVNVECTPEGDRDRARQRRREWQRSLLQSYEEPETSSTGSVRELKTEDAFSKRQPQNLQSQEDDDKASMKSENSLYAESHSSKNSISLESSDQSLEGSQEGSSLEMVNADSTEGALPVITHEDTEICVDSAPQEGSQADDEKCAIRSKELGEFNSDKGSIESLDGERKLPDRKADSLSSKSSSSLERNGKSDETDKLSEKGDVMGVVRVEIQKEKDLGDQKDVECDKGRKESAEESGGIKEEKLPSLKQENLNKMKDERSTFLSSRWRDPKRASFKDLRKQFQSGFEKQKEAKKEDRVLKGVKGKVGQAALLFGSQSPSSPSHQPLSSESVTPKRGSSSTPRRTSDRRIADQKLAGNSTRRFSSEFSLSDKKENKAETKSCLQVDSNKDEETSLNKGQEASPATSIYMTPVGTPGSPDIFYTPKEAMDGTPANLADKASVSKPSEVEEQSLLHSKRTTVVEGDQYRKKVKVEEGKLSPEETSQTQETDISTMAPTVEQITDETMLEKMLEEATIFEERKKIRARLRELRKQKRGGGDSIGPASQDPTPELDMETGDADTTTVTTERKRTRASGLSVNTTQQSTENKEVKPVGSTALSPVSPAAKTVRTDSNLSNDHTTKVVETDDGKTKTMTMTSVKTAPGAKSTQVTTMTKSNDGSGTTSASVKQETTTTKVETSGDGTKTSFSKTTTSTFSSSSSSTDKPATGKPQSKFQLELEEKRKKRAEQQKVDEAKWKADQEARRKAAYEKKKREEAEAAKKKASLMDKFGGKATSVGPTGPKKTVAGGSTRMMAQNPATIKAKLLEWAQRCTRGYANVKIENFSGSWCDGMAFCAVIHSYYPDAFDFNSLDPKNRRQNFDLAFETAEKRADIYPLLETDDMIMMKNKPDWKCVFTYVQALYRGLHKAAGQVPA